MKSAITSTCLAFLFLTSSFNVSAQLVGMLPTGGNIGQNFVATITATNNIFDGSSGPGGNILNIYLQKGNDFLIMFDSNWGFGYPNIIDPNTVQTALILSPTYTQPGVYDLYVTIIDPNNPNGNIQYSLPAQFTVNNPTGTISGNVYRDLNRNGVKDSGEPDLANAAVRVVPPGSNAFFVSADNSGNYSVPVYNGNHTLSFPQNSNDLLYVTTGTGIFNININNNNSTGNNFGVNGALISINPAIVQKGTSSVHTITSALPIFSNTPSAGGNITQFTIQSTPPFGVTPSSSITVIDNFTIQVTINMPSFIADAQQVDLRVITSGNNYAGTHFLRGQLNIVSPPSCDPPDSTWATFVTASSFRTNWTPVPGAYRYNIFYKVGGTSVWTQRSVAGTNSFLGIQNLNCGTNYRWKVRTVCQTATGTIRSVWTPVKVTTTLSCEAPNEDRIADTEMISVDVFPNPASEFIAIEAGADISGATEFEMYNLTGALIMKKSLDLQSGEVIEVDVNEIPEGLYFIRFSGAVQYHTKVIIQR